MPNLRDALNQIAADEARNGVVATVRNLVAKSADVARQRTGVTLSPAEQLTANGMLSSLKVQAKLTSSGNTLTLSPVDNGIIPLYGDNGVGWVNVYLASAVALSTAGSVSGTIYDVFVYYDQTLDPPAPALELVAWASETARAVALTTQDGASLKSTDTSRRFVSIVRYNGSTMLVPNIDPNGELFFGTGDPRNNGADPFTGVGMSAGGVTFGSYIWQFFAAVAGVVGVGFNAAGQLLAGAGAVILDALGVSIVAATTKGTITAYKFLSSAGVLLSGFYAYTTSVINQAEIALESIAGKNSNLSISTDAPTGKSSGTTITASVNSSIVSMISVGEQFFRVLVGKFIHNDNSGDYDAVMKGVTDAALFYSDASTDRIGIGTATPSTKLEVNGGFKAGAAIFTGAITGINLSLTGSIELKAPVTVGAATYNQLVADSYIIANRAGTITITLLAAATYPGHRLVIKTITANTVVSASSNVVPLAGGAAGTAILAATAGKWVELISDGSNWIIMSGA